MKKLLTAALTVIAATGMCAAVQAAQISVDVAQQLTENGKIQVDCTVTEGTLTGDVTVYAAKDSDTDYSEGMLYLDQFAPSATTGGFSFEFWVPDDTDTAQSFIVRVGGEGIDNPQQHSILFYNGKVYDVGDINGDGVVDKKDAKLLLAFLSGVEILSAAQREAGDVNSDGYVDIRDVSEILR